MSSAPGKFLSGKKYKFYRSDFGPLTTVPLHLNLHFDVIDARVIVKCETTFEFKGSESLNELKELKLNSKDLQIKSVERLTEFKEVDASGPGHTSKGFVDHVNSYKNSAIKPLKHVVDNDTDMLIIELDEPVKKNQQFVIRTVSIATPTSHILEGLYYDYTPPGKSCKTIITQCQQHGFQRIVPCVDMMAAKAYYTTTLVADASYTNVITNGDLAPGYYDENTRVPTPHPEDVSCRPNDVPKDAKRNVFVYYNHKVNMASYLFFAGFGYYKTYRREVEYANGNKFMIELLVFEGLVKEEHALTAINALHDSIQWVNISTGPEAAEHLEEQKQIYQLIEQREELKKQGDKADPQKLADIRGLLKQLISVWGKTGYAYTGDVYREIAMENSDYGGMENVGNTTIISSRLVPSDLLTDPGFIYLEGVKVHEFFHNINGSEVTGQSPFEIWLNEAVTVHIQRQRESVLFGDDFMRLKEVIYAFMPGAGPLAVDRSANSMAIEPEGFNRSQELVSAMTYSKAPEFVRMVELILGKPQFNRALDHYYTTFKYSNATTLDWLQSMEKFNKSGTNIIQMADGWLRRVGWPTVSYETFYDSNKRIFTVACEQFGFPADNKPWSFPIEWALNKDGKDTHTGKWIMNEIRQTFTIENVAEEPDFLSFARFWSFYGQSLHKNPKPGQLFKQALHDTDIISRYFAYRALADAEKKHVIENLLNGKNDYKVSDEYLQLHAKLLFDHNLTGSTRAMICREAEEITTFPELQHRYWEVSHAKHALMQAVYDANASKIIDLFNKVEAANNPGPHKIGLHERALKHHLFNLVNNGVNVKSVLSTRNPAEFAKLEDLKKMTQKMIESPFMSDQTFGFTQFLQLNIDEKEKLLLIEKQLDKWKSHPDSLESYISCIASSDSDKTVNYLRDLTNNPLFKYELAGHARATARAWSMNRKRSLLTDDGLELTMTLFEKIGKVNQYSAQSFISALGDLPKFDQNIQKKLINALKDLRNKTDPKKQESMYNQLNIVLKDFD